MKMAFSNLLRVMDNSQDLVFRGAAFLPIVRLPSIYAFFSGWHRQVFYPSPCTIL